MGSSKNEELDAGTQWHCVPASSSSFLLEPTVLLRLPHLIASHIMGFNAKNKFGGQPFLLARCGEVVQCCKKLWMNISPRSLQAEMSAGEPITIQRRPIAMISTSSVSTSNSKR